MRKATIALITGILFGVLLIYVLNNASPWNTAQLQIYLDRYNITTNEQFLDFISDAFELGLIWDLIDLRNLFVIVFLAGGAVTGIFSSVHLLVDKLFFKKFFEEPNHLVAVRRAVLVYLSIVGFVFLKFIGAFLWYNALSVIIISGSIEYIFINYTKEKLLKQNTQDE